MADKNTSVTEGIPRWKIALAVGAPVAVGLVGLWLYKQRRNRGAKKQVAGGEKGKADTDATDGENAGLVS